MKNNKSTDFNLEAARNLLEGGSPSEGEETEGEFSIKTVPATLKSAIASLAKEHSAGSVSSTEAQLSIKNWSQAAGYPLKAMQEDFDRELKRYDQEAIISVAEEKPTLTPEQLAEAIVLGKSDLIAAFQLAMRALGYVANRYTAMGIMHTCYSRLLNRKTGWFHYGRTRSGKSEGLECAYRLTHPGNRMRATSITQGALHSLGEIDHKFILGGELRTQRPGEDDSMQQLLRQFISEPVLTHLRLEESVGGNTKSYKRTEHSVSGFASIAWTSTMDPHSLKDEFALRLTAVPSNEDADTTRQVQDLKAKQAKDPIGTKEAEQLVIERFNRLDLSLESGDVVIPFADLIKLRNDDTASRSTFQLLLDHVRISTLYNQHKRLRASDGCWIATRDDYAAAFELVNRGAFRVMDPISQTAREAFDVLSKKYGEPSVDVKDREFRLKDICELLDKPRSTIQGWVEQWLKAEMIMVMNTLGDPSPKRYTLLLNNGVSATDLGLVPVEELPE